ncbi:LuxR C-terminal-related transcriptional regulator [uncultured Roseibium sp.]|uniref:helix-turn-helix transcriptional regulator n=1 Tax=uncultured Roseibium sp. TaxID=1936171 RepID=UPI003216CA7B
MVVSRDRTKPMAALAAAIDAAREEAESPGCGRFGPALLAWLSQITHFDHSVTFAYRGIARPPCLFETFNPAESHIFVALYQEGPYRLDPFYQTAVERRAGFWRMRELAPDRFYASEYFRTYYEKTGLAEEVGFFVPLESGVTVVVSLMRLDKSKAFSAVQIRALRELSPVVLSLVRLAWGNIAVDDPSNGQGVNGDHTQSEPDNPSQISALLTTDEDGNPLLTPREIEVVDLVLKGHSSDSIAALLGMTPGTVKVHRRNIYRKLHIRSQAELFAWFVANSGMAKGE